VVDEKAVSSAKIMDEDFEAAVRADRKADPKLRILMHYVNSYGAAA